MDSDPVSSPSGQGSSQWPPVEGRYQTGNRESPVAVCTMASVDIRLPMDKVAIVGKCVTENLGIEKIVKNVVANPNIRFIIVAGKESMGHFVDNALESLVENGTDHEGRIIGAKGGIPVLKNVTNEEVERFRKQVQIVNMAGETDTGKIMERVNEYFERPTQPSVGEAVVTSQPMKVAVVTHPITDWVQDPKGYFTITADKQANEITVNHHDSTGRILTTYSGKNAEDLYHHIISNAGAVSRLDHAAYLGRELAKAETALFNHSEYEQDTGLVLAAPGASAVPVVQHQPSGVQGQSSRVDTDGKVLTPLPTHGKLISVKKVEKSKETILTYVVNDREFPMRSAPPEEEQFREFLRDKGMCRVF